MTWPASGRCPLQWHGQVEKQCVCEVDKYELRQIEKQAGKSKQATKQPKHKADKEVGE